MKQNKLLPMTNDPDVTCEHQKCIDCLILFDDNQRE